LAKCLVFSYLALDPEETRALNAAYHERIHRDQSNLIPLDPEAYILTGRRPTEIFFSASFSLPRKKLPFDGQLKTRQAPGTSSEPYLIPVLAGHPRKLVQALDTLRSLKSFPSTKAVNTTTGPQLPKYVSAVVSMLPRDKWVDAEYCLEWMVEDGSDTPWAYHLAPGAVDRAPNHEDDQSGRHHGGFSRVDLG
jgi:hypothetical protein